MGLADLELARGEVRLLDLGLFRIGGEKYAELDHHYGATTLQKHDVTVRRDGVAFDYIAKEGKRRTITVTDHGVRSVVRALVSSDSASDFLFSFRDGDAWQPLRSYEVSSYITTRAGGHFTAKEFRIWNATVLMALLLANADPAPTARRRKGALTAAVRAVADSLGDTPAVARGSCIDPKLINLYASDGQLAGIPRLPALLPAADGPVSGQTVLVHGVRGSVSSLAAQLARWAGATVIGIVRTDAEAGQVSPGTADHVVSLQSDAASAIRRLAPDGVDRVVEVALSANADLDAAVVRNGAVMAAYASPKDRPELPFWPMLFANVTIRLLGSDDFPQDAKDAAARDLTEAAAQSALSITVADVIPLAQIAAAYELIESGRAPGRVLICIP